MNKNLKEKAISIKGKSYVLVSDRVIYFNENYSNGCIQTMKLDNPDRVEFKAVVIPDCDKPQRAFTGHSQAVWGDGYINKTSAMENAETSAVGRALALMGIGVIDSIASVDEINKAKNTETLGTCSTCGAEMARSKAGNLYCPKSFTDPKHKSTRISEEAQEFLDLLPE